MTAPPLVGLLRAIVAAGEGDDVGALGREHGGRHVVAACAAPCRGALCLSCRCYLANQAQLEMHAGRGIHVIARICHEHGPEVFRWWGE